MAKRLKRGSSKRPTTAEAGSMTKQGNPTLLIGILLAVAVAVLFWVLTTRLQEKDSVMVTRGSIPAFSTITPGQLQATVVPKDSITDQDLTESKYKELAAKGQSLVNRIELLSGQRVQIGAVTASSTGSLAAVKEGERVIAIPATFSGAVAGIATAGSVVDIFSGSGASDGGSSVVSNAKVLALGAGSAAAANVRPGSNLKNGDSSGSSIIVVLALKAEDAAKVLALPQVALALDPRLSFTENGTICPVNRCAALNQVASQPGNNRNPQDPASKITQDSTPVGP